MSKSKPAASEGKTRPPRLRGIYKMQGYWIGLTKQGGIPQYIAMASTGHVWFVSSDPTVEKVA